jgi:hypothetical protein
MMIKIEDRSMIKLTFKLDGMDATPIPGQNLQRLYKYADAEGIVYLKAIIGPDGLPGFLLANSSGKPIDFKE